MPAELDVIDRVIESQAQTYDDFCNPEVIVTTYGDSRLGCLIDWPCRFEQAYNGPTFVVIRPTATDEQLGKVADRFGIDIEELRTFRATKAK